MIPSPPETSGTAPSGRSIPGSRTAPFALWAGVAGLVVAVLAAYLPVFSAGFVWDDDVLITHNPFLRMDGGLAAIWDLTQRNTPDYFPLTSTLFWLEYRFFGNEPAGYHAVNVLLHLLNVLGLWWILRGLRIPGAWLGAALFALHPLNASSVAWVAEQKNTLSFLLAATATAAWLAAHSPETPPNRERRLVTAAFFFYLLAVLAKSSAVVLPLLFLLLDGWRRRPFTRGAALQLAPFLAAGALLGLVAISFQHAVGTAAGPAFQPLVWLTTGLAVSGRAVFVYLARAFFPFDLCAIHPLWRLDFSAWQTFAPTGLAAAALLALGIAGRRAEPCRAILAGAGWFILAMLPLLGFVPAQFFRFSYVADHWTYFSLPGMTALAGSGLAAMLMTPRPAWLRVLAAATAALILAGFGALTFLQAETYRDRETLWRSVLVRNPEAVVAWNNYGIELARGGGSMAALRCFDRAVRLNPASDDAHQNRGTALMSLGRVPEAVAAFQASIRIRPNSSAWRNLGIALNQAGRREEAFAAFEQSLRLNPYSDATHLAYAMVLDVAGRTAESSVHYAEVLRLNPDNIGALVGLAKILSTSTDQAIRNPAQAEILARRAMALTANREPEAWMALASARAAQNDVTGAADILRQRLEAWPPEPAGSPAAGMRERARQQLQQYTGRMSDDTPRGSPQ